MSTDPSGEPSDLLTIEELSVRCKISVRQLRRLKDAGKISYFQPGGKGGKLLFPPDAIERTRPKVLGSQPSEVVSKAKATESLSGPKPAWMQAQRKREKD